MEQNEMSGENEMNKHTELPFINGWGNGLTGPTTPSCGAVVCGGKDWPHTVISKNEETIAIIPKQKDGIMEENAAFIVKAANNHHQLLGCLKELVYNYPSNNKLTLSLKAAEEAIKQAEAE